MRTSRCILYTALGTVLCLLYVFQQTEIVKLGYRIHATGKVLETAVDHKTMLEYTLSTLESPRNLDQNLILKNDGFEMAQGFRLVKVDTAGAGISPMTRPKMASRPRGTIFSRLAFQSLFASRQAEAKTLK